VAIRTVLNMVNCTKSREESDANKVRGSLFELLPRRIENEVEKNRVFWVACWIYIPLVARNTHSCEWPSSGHLASSGATDRTQHSTAQQHLGKEDLRRCISTGLDERQQRRLVAERGQVSGLHDLSNP
jgi:hypothetical protein